MPTPLGHALMGAAIGWSAEALARRPMPLARSVGLATTCAGLAMLPDLDLIYPPSHRTMTHSVTAALLAGVLCSVVYRRAPSASVWPMFVICSMAYASHLLLDWLGGDTKEPPGLQLLWPFSAGWFISPRSLFEAMHRGSRMFTLPVMLSNALAFARELALLVPVALVAYAWRQRRLGVQASRVRSNQQAPAKLTANGKVASGQTFV